MIRSDYDVVIVGARCAGAPLATFLARDGARVLMLDRSPLPSDQVLSTHTIHPPGIDVLDELGVGAAVRSVATPMATIRFVKGDASGDVSFSDGRADYCPRRERLDRLLQEAAARAGAELRDRTRVTEVLFEYGRAVGVRAVSSGEAEEIRADLVVGADGRNSTVAEEVEAEEYMGYDAPRGMYWAYWEPPPDGGMEEHPFDMYLAHRDRHIRVVFQTDHGQLLIGSLPPVDEAHTWSGDPLASLRTSLHADPITAELVGDRDPVTRVRGTLKERYFFRRAAGDGWVLVGDAGHHKDFVIGDGITEALLQARSLARAIGAGTDESLVRWWRERDVRAYPQFSWGRDEGAAGEPGILESLVVEQVASDPALQERMTLLPEHESTPYDVLPISVILRCVSGALLRGRLEVLPEFLAQARRAREFQGVMKRWKGRLEEASASAVVGGAHP